MTVPDGIPVLSAGMHMTPEQGACVMEFVSVLAGERWSDMPACVSDRLIYAAQHVNDGTDDAGRRELAEMAPLFIGTRGKTEADETALGQKLYPMWTKFRHAAADFAEYKDQRGSVRINMDGYATYLRMHGVPLLREMIRMCDEYNGYDRSEATAVVEPVEVPA